MKKVLFVFLLIFALFSGCIDNKSQNVTDAQKNVNELTTEKSNFPQFNDIKNRSSRWSLGNRSRRMLNLTEIHGRSLYNLSNMTERFLEIRKRLNLSANASEKDVHEALQKIRRQR